MGEIREFFDMEDDLKGSDPISKPARSHDPEFEETLPPSRTSSSSFILDTCSRSQSYQYARPPSPLHFYHLNSPNPSTAYFMPNSLPSRSIPKPRRRRRCGFFPTLCYCCCSLCSVFITASILLGLTALITWLILRPIHAPRYSLENVEFRTLNVDTAPSFGLTADVVFTIAAENPNKRLGFKYESIRIESSYRGYVFGHSRVAKFSLGHGNVTKVESKFVVEDYVFTPGTLGERLAADVKGARVRIHVRASAKVRVTVGVVTSFAVKVLVDCDVEVKPPQGTDPSSVIEKTCKLTR